MPETTPEQNKATVLKAFDTLFNQRDYDAAELFWSSEYIQHSAHIAPGREGLFQLIRSLPPTLSYENQLIVGEGDYVIACRSWSRTRRPASRPNGPSRVEAPMACRARDGAAPPSRRATRLK